MDNSKRNMTDKELNERYIRKATDPLIFKGVKILRDGIGDGNLIAELEITPDMINPNGVVHGSMIFTLADIAAGLGAYNLGYKAATINGSINFIRPGLTGKLLAKNDVIHHGKTTIVSSVDVLNDEDKLIARCQFTMYITEKIS